MSRSSWRLGLSIAAALAVPATLTPALGDPSRGASGLTAAPFAWPGLLAAHLVAAAPIGLILASRLARASPPRRGMALAWPLAGLAAAWALASLGPDLAAGLDRAGVGFLARSALRSALAVGLVVPWLAAPGGRGGREALGSAGRVGLAVAAALAWLPPMAYAARLIEARSTAADEDLATGRLARAGATLEGLAEIGSPRPVGGLPPARARVASDAALGRLRRVAARPLPEGAGPGARVDRAFLLIQLDRPEEAEGLLGPLAGSDPDAALLLGAVLRDRSRWAESERAYRRALEATLPGAGRSPADASRAVTAFDGMAEAARSDGRPAVAEGYYRRAAGLLPGHAAHFALQLGRHYLAGGRPAAALAQIREATRLDPATEPQARPLIRRIRAQTPGCLLPR